MMMVMRRITVARTARGVSILDCAKQTHCPRRFLWMMLLQVISCRGYVTRILLTVGATRIAEAILEEIFSGYRIFVKEEE
jgi:hypothetical protein